MCVGRDRSWHHSFHRYRRRVSYCHKSQHHDHRRSRRFDRFVARQLLTTIVSFDLEVYTKPAAF